MYTPTQFEQCRFNPLEKNLLKTHPTLEGLFPEGDGDPMLDPEKVLRYVIALYDPKSPLQKDHPELESRRIVAAQVAGYDAKKDAEIIDILCSCSSNWAVNVIIQYLRKIVRSRTWASIKADEQAFWEFTARLFMPISEESDKDSVGAVEKKLKLSQGKETLSQQIEVNEQQFYGGDEQVRKKAKKSAYSPEAMAGL